MSSRWIFSIIIPKSSEICEYIESIPTNNRFIGRSLELKEFSETKSKIIIIEGISGIGKTYIAVELAKKSSVNKNMFWLNLNEITTINPKIPANTYRGKKGLIHYLLCCRMREQAERCLPDLSNLRFLKEELMFLLPLVFLRIVLHIVQQVSQT